MDSEISISRRKLPHWESAGSVYFITFATANGLALDDGSRDIVLGTVRFHQNKKYELYSCVVMPAHVHLVIRPLEKEGGRLHSVSEIMHSIKSYSAQKVNRQLGKKGQLWLDESYDRITRDDREFIEKMNYIINNPVRSGLVETAENYRWLYVGGQSEGE